MPIVDATSPKNEPPQVVTLADKAGVKKELLEAVNEIIKAYEGKMPKDFGAEELYFMFGEGLNAAGLDTNFRVKSLMTLARAFLHGYTVGKLIKR